MEILHERVNNIIDRVDRICEDQDKMRSRIEQHERWINQRETEIDAADIRLQNMEGAVADHQSWIDERRPLAAEFQEMKRTIQNHENYINSVKGGNVAIASLIAQIGALLGIITAVLRLFKII
jgi:chromosome segregation ATPase